ncbi:MAG: hypothetical protein V4601_01400 [Pseudomonadota bacterium]
MRLLTVAVLGFSVLSGAALAQSPTPPPAPPAEAAAALPDANEKICIDQNPTASTRVNSQRICRTRAEWEKRGGVPK